MAIQGAGVMAVELDELLAALNQCAATADETAVTPPEALEALKRSGCLGAMVPTEYGGLGQDAVFGNWMLEQIAAVDPSIAIIAFQHMQVCGRIAEWGTEEQRHKFLPRLAAGHWIAASAWSESGAGANKQNIGTRATRLSNGNWRLSGTKTFTTGAGLADIYLVLAQTGDPGDNVDPVAYGSVGQSFFLVASDGGGVSTTSNINLTGMRGSSTGFIALNECEVADDSVLGPLGAAPGVIASVRQSGLTLGAISVGIAQAALNCALQSVRARGLDRQQVVRYRLADLHMQVEAARGLVERAGRRQAANPGLVTLHSKVFASETSERVCREVQQLAGGTGFIRGSLVERLGRDARAVALMGPVNDLAREIAGRELLP